MQRNKINYVKILERNKKIGMKIKKGEKRKR